MEAFRIRRGGSVRSVPDLPALQALAAAGDIRASDEVHTPAGWVPATSVPELRGRLRPEDPWAAWSDVDSVDATSLYKRMVDEPEELPVEAVTPVGEPIVSIEDLVAIDADPITDEVPLPARPVAREAPPAARPVTPGPATPVSATSGPATPGPAVSPATSPAAAASPAARALAAELGAAAPRRKEPLPLSGRDAPPRGRAAPGPGEVGEIIDFPRQRAAPPAFDALVRPPRPPKAPPLVRTSRLAAMVVAGLLAVLLGYSWIRVSAYSRAGVSAVGPVPTRSAEPKALAPPSPLVLIDAELRKALPATPRDVKEAGDLSDALLVELVQQRIDVVVADGLVTKWIGMKGDEPRIAEVRVQYRSAGDITRELGAVALVVGRYKRFYHLDVPVFDVTDVTAGTVTRIDATKAEAYYQARISLEELLSSIAGK